MGCSQHPDVNGDFGSSTHTSETFFFDDLEQFCLTKDEIQFKTMVDQKWGYMTYHGEWYHPLKNALDAFVEETQKFVNGTYKVKLLKGTIDIMSRESKTGLFSAEIRSIKAKGFDQRWCANAAKVKGLRWQILAKRAQIK